MGTPTRQHLAKESASGADGAERRIAFPGVKTKPHLFGVDHRVACSKCGQDTYLRRRSARSADGETFEVQSFACRACKCLTTRTVDAAGRLFG
jgi:hypothetical protein